MEIAEVWLVTLIYSCRGGCV